jgi:hypothetical protein
MKRREFIAGLGSAGGLAAIRPSGTSTPLRVPKARATSTAGPPLEARSALASIGARGARFIWDPSSQKNLATRNVFGEFPNCHITDVYCWVLY